jgi:hypothetical protein
MQAWLHIFTNPGWQYVLLQLTQPIRRTVQSSQAMIPVVQGLCQGPNSAGLSSCPNVLLGCWSSSKREAMLSGWHQARVRCSIDNYEQLLQVIR